MNSIRVFLVENLQMVRHGLRLIIDAEPDMKVVGEASNGREAIVSIVKTNPDVVVFGIDLPQRNGLEMVEELLREQSQFQNRLLALTAFPEPDCCSSMQQMGISGFLSKQSSASELLEAIRRIAKDGILQNAAAANAISKENTDFKASQALSNSSLISVREEEVIRWIACGFSNKEVAAKLEISVKTVETHKARAMTKLQLKGRSELLRFAIANGWLTVG